MHIFYGCWIAIVFAVAGFPSPAMALQSTSDTKAKGPEPPFNIPVDMAATADFHAKELSGNALEQKFKVRYQWDGETAYAATQWTEGDRSFRMDFLYRDGELIRFNSDIVGTTTEYLGAILVTSKIDPSLRQPAPGEIFNAYPDGLAVAGWFNGYSYDDYFARGAEVHSEQQGDVVHVSGRSKYGDAEAWLDSSKTFLPRRLVIHKGPDDYTTSGRVLKNVRFDKNDPRSDLVSITLEVKDVTFGQDPEGRPYIKECTQLVTSKSERGIESEEEVHWVVDSIKFKPAFEFGGVYPDPALGLKDGQPVSAEGASQLPFKWSQAARWVVPAVADLAAQGSAPAKSMVPFYVFIHLGLVVCLAAWWIYRRRVHHGT